MLSQLLTFAVFGSEEDEEQVQDLTAWGLTARDIVTLALEENAIIAAGEDPTADEMARCLVRLNAVLKSWQAKGLNSWREATGTLTIPADTASIAVAAEVPGVRDILSVRVVHSATYERPLAMWERDDYLILPNKVSRGQPTAFYVSKGVSGSTLYVWPVPSTETELAIDYVRTVETITDPSQRVDFPEEYQEALYAALAVRCAGLFGQQPSAELYARAAELERIMLDADRPESYFMGPVDESRFYGRA